MDRDIVMKTQQYRSRSPRRDDVIDRSRAPDDIYECDICKTHMAYVDKANHEKTKKHRNNIKRIIINKFFIVV